jgi:hypothetical protein
VKFSTSLVKFGSVGDLALELKKALTAIAAGWNVEHNPDGTHKATMTLPDTVAMRDEDNVFSGGQTWLANPGISNTSPSLLLNDTDQPANQRLFVLTNDAGLCYLRPTTDTAAPLNNGLIVDRTGNVVAASAVYERGRLVPMGEWTDVPFNAANFTGVGGTWTVTSATYAYIVLGKTVVFSLVVPGTSTITGAPTALNVAYPAGLASPTRVMGTSFHYVMGATTPGTGLCQMHTAFPTVLYITRDATATAFAAGTFYLYLQGHYSIA